MKGIRWIPAVIAALLVTTASSVWAQASAAAPTPIIVTLTEYQLALNPAQAPAGPVDFIVTNSGKAPHSLTVSGMGVRAGLPTVLQPGQQATLRIADLQPGSYTLICPVGNHAALGMTTAFLVTPPVTRVTVSLTEYRVTPNLNQAPAGNVSFVVTNNGTAAHSLAIRGDGINQALPNALQPGESAILQVVNLQPGTYTLYCPVGNHAAMGMQATFTVMKTEVTVNASLTEYCITLSQNSAPAGDVAFVVTNNGTVPHSLGIRGPHVDARLPGVLQPGQTAVLRVAELRPGAYRVYCPVGDHAERGMTTTFTTLASGAVAPAAGAGTNSRQY
ncbi:MAG: cupredoxin domain-containing protein [Armatimonadota bacterium]